jgi:protein-disulfide isomerase
MSRLTPPVGDHDHVLGRSDAPITLLEYGDYECPFCGMAHPVVKAILRQLGDQLRFAFRHFPLTQVHPHAEHAARMAEAAGSRGRFWPVHDLLYANQNALSDEDLFGYAAAVGLDPGWAGRALSSPAFAAKVREDFMSGVRSGVNGTPTFFINGVRHDGGWDEATLLAAIRRAAYVVVER